MTSRLLNPVIRGFNPDPSILRVGDDYYIATSTFEYHPAVRLHHSTNLQEWEVIGHALDEGFDLRGVPDSGGVWAPSLTHSEGQFWLAYSVVRSMDGDDLDIDNYLVTGASIDGPWSAPIYLGSRGFDFSFFQDSDGTHWIVGVQWDQRSDVSSFAGIVIEQYFPDEKRTSGHAELLFQDTELVEGPNLYQVDGWYYLLLAEGGTGWNHGITTARSRSRFGPYERDPLPAVLTSRDAPGEALQKAGHGELVRTANGDWWLVHLASRPVLHQGERYSTLGRETCLQRVVFDAEGWLRLQQGGHHAATSVELDSTFPERDPSLSPADDFREEFLSTALDSRSWSTLRTSLPPKTLDLTSRPGWLRMRGGHSPASVFDQSMVLTPVREHLAAIELHVDASPRSPREMAGLILWYDRNGWIWLHVTGDSHSGRYVIVTQRDGAATTSSHPVPAPEGPLTLGALIAGPTVTFQVNDRPLDGTYPVWTLSDDHGAKLRFTGLHAGARTDDLDGRGWSADLTNFSVRYQRAETA
ncbi:family 43 glycosylhydrolase [Microbacterium sp. ZW T5_45]|uniref:family 43 glycosylhydrolase n=1 Tax=Microbacterium sp. ZW T5_45 TaxID=3378080 RepID=UPI00385232FB